MPKYKNMVKRFAEKTTDSSKPVRIKKKEKNLILSGSSRITLFAYMETISIKKLIVKANISDNASDPIFIPKVNGTLKDSPVKPKRTKKKVTAHIVLTYTEKPRTENRLPIIPSRQPAASGIKKERKKSK